MALGRNMMALGNDRVIVPASSTILVETLRGRSFDVAAVGTAWHRYYAAKLHELNLYIHCY
jgi:hypothetical protein